MKASWFFVILLLVFVAVFSVQNAEPINVRFLGWSYSVSAALVIQLAALLGALVGLAFGSVSARTARRRREQADAERGRRARQESIEPADRRPEVVSTPPASAHEPADRG